jgi:hypothetical protein
MVQLVFIDKTLKGRSYDLVCEKTTIGRSSDNLLCIRHPSLSRRHCEILVYGVEVIVRYLSSRNGTLVDGKRLSNQQCQVKSGQVISFGVIEARLDISVPEPEEDDASGYFDVSKYQAELEDLRHLGSSDRTECVIAPPSKPCPKWYRLLSRLIVFLSLAVMRFHDRLRWQRKTQGVGSIPTQESASVFKRVAKTTQSR